MTNARSRRRQRREWRQRCPLLCYLQCISLLLGQTAAQTGFDSGAPSLSDIPSAVPTSRPSIVTLSMKGPWAGKLQHAPETLIDIITLSSIIPSDTPSLPPTSSSAPSNVPSTSARPSASPSTSVPGLPSFIPSDSPSLTPSDSPSPIPSNVPSYSPTRLPTHSPSSAPTHAPSSQPSSAPSATPSAHPSKFPSSAPSVSPSTTPTVSPSSTPSSMPTLSCHDVASYRSPINNLTCDEHIGTDCTKWRYVGLSSDEVENLVLSCPISCNITCGSFSRSDITISFKLKNVYTFMSPAAVDTLSTVSIEYLTEYVNDRAAAPDSIFYLDEVELLSQQIIQQNLSPGRTMRYLQEEQPYVDLLLEVAYRGVAVDLDADDIQKYHVEGVDDPGYTLALRRSGDPTLANARVTTDINNETVVPPNATDDKAGNGSGGIAAAVVCSFLVLGAAGAGWLYHNKRKSTAGMQFVQEKQSAFESRPNSPFSDQQQQDLRSPASSFSFEVATGYVEKLVRQIASLSPRSFTYMSENEGGSRQVTSNSESSDNTTEEHPYTGIIPPMIVIDHIDSGASNDTAEGKEKKKKQEQTKEKIKEVVPSLRIQASSELIRELHVEQVPSDPATLVSYVWSNASQKQSMMMSAVDTTPDENDQYLESPLADEDTATERVRGESFRVFSSDEEEDDDDDDDGEETDENCPNSTAIVDSPVAMMETRLPTPQRAIARSRLCDVAEESSMSSMQDTQDLFTSTPLFSDLAMTSNNISGGTSRSFFAWPRPPRPPGENSPRSTTASPLLTTTVDGEVAPSRTLSAAQPSSEDNQSEDGEGATINSLPRIKNSPSAGFLRSLWNRSPTGRSTSEHGNDRDGSTPPSGDEQRTQMPPPGHTRSNSKGSSASASVVSEGFIYKYQAPSKGKLGLVIECTELGPVVVKVKDYSPLLGQIQEGDRIVEINGSKIGQMPSLQDVSTLLAARSTWTNVVKLTICRPYNSSSGGGGDNDDTYSNNMANNSLPRRHARDLSQASFETIPLTDSGGRPILVSSGSASWHPGGNASSSPSEQQQQSQQQPSPPFLTSSETVARGPPMAAAVLDTSIIDAPPRYQPPPQHLSQLQRLAPIHQLQVNQQQEGVSYPTRRQRSSITSNNNNNKKEGRHFFSNSF